MHGRNRLRRLLPALALVALAATLVSPAQAGQGNRHSAPVAPAAGWSTEARAFLSRLWQGGTHGLRGLFGAEGASLDPHGGAPTGSAGAGTAVVPGHGGI